MQTLCSPGLLNASLLCTLAAGLAFNPPSARAQDDEPEITTGPEVGESIPAFELRDQNGELQSFETLKGPKGLFLLFTRSADW